MLTLCNLVSIASILWDIVRLVAVVPETFLALMARCRDSKQSRFLFLTFFLVSS